MEDNFLIAGNGIVVKLKNGRYWTVPFPTANATIDDPGYRFAFEKHGAEVVNVGEMDEAERVKVRNDVEKQLGESVYTHPKSEKTEKVKNRIPKILQGLKLPGVLGILDIMGMKKEYDQIVEGTHPSGITMTEEEFKEKFGNQVYADGGYVTNPFVKDIFDN